jgi:hypothetical protein
MDVPFLLSAAQMRRIEPYFPLSHGVPRVDDRRVVSGIIYVLRGGLMWRDAPKGYGPHKTIYNRFIRWSRVVPRSDRDLAGQLVHGLLQHQSPPILVMQRTEKHSLFVQLLERTSDYRYWRRKTGL